LMYSLKTLKIVFLHVFVSIKASTFFLKSFSCFATIAFNVIELEQFELEPTALNSNLFPKQMAKFYFYLYLKERLNFTYDI
jgi:hypothetical protein